MEWIVPVHTQVNRRTRLRENLCMPVCVCMHVLLCAPVALAFAQFALEAKQRFASKTMLFFVVKKCTEIRQGLFMGIHVLIIFTVLDFFANAHSECSFYLLGIERISRDQNICLHPAKRQPLPLP